MLWPRSSSWATVLDSTKFRHEHRDRRRPPRRRRDLRQDRLRALRRRLLLPRSDPHLAAIPSTPRSRTRTSCSKRGTRGRSSCASRRDYSASAIHADQWVTVRPGTDAALALGMAHVMIEEGLYDRSFVAEQTDLPLLVREDDGNYLRRSDLEAGEATRSCTSTIRSGESYRRRGEASTSRASTRRSKDASRRRSSTAAQSTSARCSPCSARSSLPSRPKRRRSSVEHRRLRSASSPDRSRARRRRRWSRPATSRSTTTET